MKQGCWIAILSLLSIVVVIVLTILGSLLIDLSLPTEAGVPSPRQTAFNLPTVAVPDGPTSPPTPQSIQFVPEKPIKGYPNCEAHGFRGAVKTSEANDLRSVEVVVWTDNIELLTLDRVDEAGSYLLEFAGKPTMRKLWIQVYRNDVPVSEPLPLEIQIDCENGFQIYQIDWRQSVEE